MITVRNKLIISYILLALVIIAVIGIILNIFLEQVFAEYAIKKQQRQMNQIVTHINQDFRYDTPIFRQEVFEVIGRTALENGMILHVSTSSGEIDWDAKNHYREQCRIVLEHAKYNLHSVNPSLEGKYQEQNFLLGHNVGTVTIGFYGPYNYSDDDVSLIITINKVLINITIGSLLLAIGIGVYMARRLSLPLTEVLKATKKIAKGEFGTRIDMNSKTKEIHDLMVSVNDMAGHLHKLEQMKRRLTSDVAHELRTPLANLQSQAEAMIDGYLEPDKKRLQSFYAEIERLNTLINDLQKLTDIDDESIKLNKEFFSVESFLANIVCFFQLDLERKHLTLSVACPTDLQVHADKVRVHQILVNIVSNAVKYSPEHGIIHIRACPKSQKIEFCVEDNGCGISEEDLPFIFERFYRADKSRTRNTGGSGIGLAITKALVEAHGGRIHAQSAINQGTSLTFCI
jgi:signal transduction histidine kinase